MTSSYDSDSLQVLEGLEAVRKRPGMYIGATDSRGLLHTVWELIDNAVDEALAGHCATIEVSLHADGSVEVTDDGRGIPTGVNAKTGLTGVELVFTKLHAGGKFGGSGYQTSGGLHGVGASVVNALSTRLDVEVTQHGKRHTMSFGRGKPGTFSGDGPDAAFTATPGKLTVAGKARKGDSGTRVRYWPDTTMFDPGSTIDLDKTHERARQTAFLVPGLTITVHDLRGDEPQTDVFSYEGGIADFVDSFCTAAPLTDVVELTGEQRYTEQVQVVGGETTDVETVERTMQVEVALRWVNDFDTDVRSYVNIVSTPKGGTHVAGFERALVKTVKDAVEAAKKTKTAKDGIVKDDVLEGLRAVVLVRIPEPQFESQTKETLGTPAARQAVASVVTSQLTAWLDAKTSKTQAKALIGKVASASVTREQIRQAKETRRRKSALESASALPEKLADCRSSDVTRNELFIIEGDSAGGTLKGARDAEFQALLPLRGKILNTLKANEKRMLDNAECAAIIAAMGAGSGRTFDLSQTRYGRLVLTMDADVDGSHIRCLVLTLIFRYLRPLLEHGHVYSAVPPLHRITEARTGVHHYTYSEAERAALLAKLDREGKTVKATQRYKGLGEMDADQLYETTVCPENRRLRRITLDDAEDAEAAFTLLMGEDVPPRREWIVANSAELDADVIDA